MTRKEEQAALLAMVTWVLGWGLWAVALDTTVTAADSVGSHAVLLHMLLRDGLLGELWAWVNMTDFHPPLPYVVAGLLSAPLGGGSFGVRMSMVLLHGVAVFQVHRLGQTVTGDRSTSVLAALAFAVTPLVAGLFRLDFQEPMATVMVLATLQVAVTTDLHRQRRRAMLLGLVIGLGALSKLSYPAVLVLPALIFLGLQVRSLRAAINAALALVVCLAVSGWWYLGHFDNVLWNWQMSTNSQPLSAWLKLLGYFVDPSSNIVLTAAALPGLVLAWRRRSMERNVLVLLTSTWFLGTAGFVFIFDFWVRYILLLLPLSALFAAVAGAAAIRLFPPRWRRSAGAVLAAVICGTAMLATLVHDPKNLASGLVAPDRRDRSAISKGLDLLAAQGGTAIWAADCDHTLHETGSRLRLWQATKGRDAIRWIFLEDVLEQHNLGSLHAMVITSQSGSDGQQGAWLIDGVGPWKAIQGLRKRQIGRFEDESSFIVSVYRVLTSKGTDRAGGAAPPRKPTAGSTPRQSP